MGVNPVTGGDGAMLIKEIREGRWKARQESLLSTPPLLLPPALAPAEAVRSLLSGKGSLPLEEDEGERRMRGRGGAPWCKAQLAQLASVALQMPVTLPGGNLWLSSQLCCPGSAGELCCLWKGWEQ